MVGLARDPAQFRFLSDCAPQASIVLGDARLTLAEAPPAGFDVLILDAFSSDSIPVHLLTREALSLYMSRLAEGGLLVFHISNRHMDLLSVVAAQAEGLGLVGLHRWDEGGETKNFETTYKSNPRVAVLARNTEELHALAENPAWQSLPASDMTAWTDDYSNVLGVILSSED